MLDPSVNQRQRYKQKHSIDRLAERNMDRQTNKEADKQARRLTEMIAGN